MWCLKPVHFYQAFIRFHISFFNLVLYFNNFFSFALGVVAEWSKVLTIYGVIHIGLWHISAQDMNLSSYVPKANVDHTISGQGTGISTLDHPATTPRAFASISSYSKVIYFVIRYAFSSKRNQVEHASHIYAVVPFSLEYANSPLCDRKNFLLGHIYLQFNHSLFEDLFNYT